MYKAVDVAQYIVNYCDKKNLLLPPQRLQKLLYFTQAYYLICKNKPLFKDDILAWKSGVIVREVYNKYKFFGNGFIYDETNDVIILDEDKFLIEEVILKYKDTSTMKLDEIIKKQSPWVDNFDENKVNVIAPQDILNFFLKGEREELTCTMS